MLYVAEERTAGGRLFHALGPATANARSPIVDNNDDNNDNDNDADGIVRKT